MNRHVQKLIGKLRWNTLGQMLLSAGEDRTFLGVIADYLQDAPEVAGRHNRQNEIDTLLALSTGKLPINYEYVRPKEDYERHAVLVWLLTEAYQMRSEPYDLYRGFDFRSRISRDGWIRMVEMDGDVRVCKVSTHILQQIRHPQASKQPVRDGKLIQLTRAPFILNSAPDWYLTHCQKGEMVCSQAYVYPLQKMLAKHQRLRDQRTSCCT